MPIRCKTHVRIIVVLFFCMFLGTQLKAQLKIGDQPTNINKSAILELQSTKQGFLLPRLTDSTTINTYNPPDGMLIYFNPGNAGTGLYIRKSGYWQRITVDSLSNKSWSVNGNTIGTGNANIGSLDAQSISVITNSIQRILVDGNSGNVSIANNLNVAKEITGADSIYGKNLFAQDSVKGKNFVAADSLYLPNLQTSTTNTQVLVINPTTGAVSKRVLDPDIFKTWAIGAFANTDNTSGLEKKAGDPTLGQSDSLILHAASVNAPGGVSTLTQSFAGTKSFRDSVFVGGATTAPNSTLQIGGSVSYSIRTVTGATTLAKTDYTLLVNTTGGAVTITLPAATGLAGRVYIIKKIGTGGIDNALTLTGNIEGTASTNYMIYNDGTFVKVQADDTGTSWYIIER
ncbi:hypothetical protein ACI6Q2_14890 [Chitinophagaceae bacterium LWZ2-11]